MLPATLILALSLPCTYFVKPFTGTSAPQNTDLEMYAKPNTGNNAETGPIRNVTMSGEMNATQELGRSAMNIPDLYRFLMLKMNVLL